MTYSAKARELYEKIAGPQNKHQPIATMIARIEQALTLIGNEREAIGYAKGKEEAEKYEPTPFGKDCPVGMVQIEFVGVDPKLKYSPYGWKPSPSAFLEVYVDGQRYRIDVGNFDSFNGIRRGLHICGPIDMVVDKHSLNAVDVYLPSTLPSPPKEK